MNKFLNKFLNKYDLNNRFMTKNCECRSASDFSSAKTRWNGCNERMNAPGLWGTKSKSPTCGLKTVQFTVQLTGNLTMCPWHSWPMNLQCCVNQNSRLFELWIASNDAAILDSQNRSLRTSFSCVCSSFFKKQRRNMQQSSWAEILMVAPWPASSQIPWLVPTGRWPPAERRSCHSQMVQQPANAHRDLTAKWWKMLIKMLIKRRCLKCLVRDVWGEKPRPFNL